MLSPLEAYVDEFGDRGFSASASPQFAMTALIVPPESLKHLRAVTIGLRGVINTNKPLHWVEHFTPKPKHAWRRHLAAELLAGIPGAQLIFVLADKKTLRASTSLTSDKDRFYNYMTRLLLERVNASAQWWPGGARSVRVRLGSVKNQDHDEGLAYLGRVRQADGAFDNVLWPPKWYGPAAYDGLQMADLAMGMFSTAVRGEPTDAACAAYLLRQRALVRRSPDGQLLGWGVKIYGDDVLTHRTWWRSLS